MNLDDNDFALLGLPEQFALERAQLDTRWRSVQAEVHPDRFVGLGASAQRVSMQWAVRVNEAYQRLKDPTRRAAYLCELHGHPVESLGRSLPAALLQQQMQWRETLEEAQGADELDSLERTVAQFKSATLERLQTLLDVEHDWPAAGALVLALMFADRFTQDLHKRLEALED